MSHSLRLVPMLCMMGAIFFLSHQPGDDLQIELFAGADKLAHMAAYGILAVTVIYSFTAGVRKRRPGLVMVVSLVVVALYGILDEFHQSFIPGRYPEGADVLADMFGAFLVCGIWFYRSSRRRQQASVP